MQLMGLGTVKSCSFGLRIHKVVAERGPWTNDINDAHDGTKETCPSILSPPADSCLRSILERTV